jgi:hypothetical protein
MHIKIGTRTKFILRVLCLKISMPAKAPNGPKNATKSSFDSEILHHLLMLLSLSMPKRAKEIEFTKEQNQQRGNLTHAHHALLHAVAFLFMSLMPRRLIHQG